MFVLNGRFFKKLKLYFCFSHIRNPRLLSTPQPEISIRCCKLRWPCWILSYFCIFRIVFETVSLYLRLPWHPLYWLLWLDCCSSCFCLLCAGVNRHDQPHQLCLDLMCLPTYSIGFMWSLQRNYIHHWRKHSIENRTCLFWIVFTCYFI